jgi:hypothetical protein
MNENGKTTLKGLNVSQLFKIQPFQGCLHETLFTPDCPDCRQAFIRGYSYSTPLELPVILADYQQSMSD